MLKIIPTELVYLKIQNKIFGNIYIQYDNSIGFNFQEEITSKEIEETIELIYSKFKPLKSIPSKDLIIFS